MSVFVDTSAFHAFLDRDDLQHSRSLAIWRRLFETGEHLVTHSYTLLETIALAQSRLGLAAVRRFQADLAPLVNVHWVDAELHAAGLAGLLSGGRRASLVDFVSFETMRRRGITRAFSFDDDFRRQGYEVLTP